MNHDLHDPKFDTTIRIWDYLYRVRIPYLQGRSIDDIKKYGVALSGIKEIDRDIKTELVTVMLSINNMVEYFKEGVAVRICSQNDVKEIYGSISAHINAWRARLTNGVNLGGAPIEDLISMDLFAHAVYEHAKYHFTNEDLQTYATKHFGSIQPINSTNFFTSGINKFLNNDINGVININADNTIIPERDSLADFFQNRMIGMRRM